MKAKITIVLLFMAFILKAQCWQTITARNNTVAAIRTDGSLWLWGSNTYGQLGDGTRLNRNVPTQVEGIHTDWESVHTGTTTLAIKKDGSLWGWGFCQFGQLANDTAIDKLDKLVPIRIGTKSDWLMVQSGTLISFGIKKNGTLWAWGVYADPNIYLGLIESPSKVEDTFIYQVGSETDWQSISMGDDFVHAIKTNGTLWAYGKNLYGTLGDGTNKNSSKFIQIGNDNNWKSISAGGSTVLGLKTGGELYAWGKNTGAAFGNGTKDDISWLYNPTTHITPARIGNEKWRSVSTSGNQTLAIRDTGTLYVWGTNSYYSTDFSIDKTNPQQVGAKNTWKNVATSDFVSLPLLNTGSLYSWGLNLSGELGGENISFRISDDPYFIGCACSTVEPSGVNNQSFCNGAKLSDIKLTGTNTRWYNQPLGGFLYPSASTLIDGETYYASQTINECESAKRLAVTVAVTTVAEPTGQQEQSFCSTNYSPKQLSDLVVVGTNLRWYGALTEGNVLPLDTPLFANKTYYVCSVINGCESTKLGIKAIDLMLPPTGESTQTLCAGSTLNDVRTNSIDRRWYTVGTGGFSIPESTPVVNDNTYYASESYGIQGEGFCESTKRLAVKIILNTTPIPSGQTSQIIYNKIKIGDIVAQGSNLKFYDAPTGGNLLGTNDLLQDNKKYYVSQTIGGCESLNRLEILVSLTFTAPPTLGVSQLPLNPQIKDVNVTGTNLKWYASLLDSQLNINEIATTTYLEIGKTYYVTQTIDGFTSQQALIIYFDGTLSIDSKILNKVKISMSPNPTQSQINFSEEINTLEVFDIAGRKVKSFQKPSSSFDVSNLEKGVYILNGKTQEGKSINEKLIKEEH